MRSRRSSAAALAPQPAPGTSHDLGQNFGRAFDVKFQTEAGGLDYVWQTSWGVSTRLIGGLIMTHSDDAGLVLPPRMAPIHAVIDPIYKNADEHGAVMAAAERIKTALTEIDISPPRARYRDFVTVEIDDRPLRSASSPATITCARASSLAVTPSSLALKWTRTRPPSSAWTASCAKGGRRR